MLFNDFTFPLVFKVFVQEYDLNYEIYKTHSPKWIYSTQQKLASITVQILFPQIISMS